MKKLLTFFWVIIIGGTIFISIHLFKPSPQTEKITEVPETENINQIVIEKKSAVTNEETESFQEYIKSGDDFLTDGSVKEAIESYQKATKINPGSSDALLRLGEAHLKDNQPDKAREVFNAASQLKPDSQYIQVAVARAHLNSRSIEAAKSIIWQLDQNNVNVKYYKGIILILYKEFEETEKIFSELTQEDIPVEIIQKSQRFLEAFKTFSYYREGEPLFLELLLAKALTEVEEYEASIPLLFEILNQKNNYRDAWVVLGFSYLNTNKAAEAIDSFKQAETLEPDKPENLFFLGLAHFANNEVDKAIHYIEKADESGYEPKDHIKLKLGDLYLIKEQYSQAAQKYEEVIALNPKNIDIFVRAVWLNIDKRNNPKKAIELATKSLQFHPNDPMAFNLTGWAYTAADELDKGEEYLKIALSMYPDFDAANLNFGWLFEKRGQSKLAKEYYKKAYIIGQNNPIGNLAAKKFNRLTEKEMQQYYQLDISAP